MSLQSWSTWTCTLLLILWGTGSATALWYESPFTYVCRNERCRRIETTALEAGETGQALDVCKLNCAPGGVLWPKPTGNVELGRNFFKFYPQNVFVSQVLSPSPAVDELIAEAFEIFKIYLLQNHPDYEGDGVSHFPPNSPDDPIAQNSLYIRLETDGVETTVKIGNDESYTITHQSEAEGGVSVLRGATYFGLRHALETLSQIIAYDDVSNCLVTLDSASVTDSPAYLHRGVMLDSSRNFVTLDKIFRNLDGMSYNKMNVFHWHMMDTQAFPFESTRVPELTKYGAYSPKKVYTVDQMKQVVHYAKVRGIKVVLEFDAPAHVGYGWQWGPSAGKGDLVLCLNQQPYAEYCNQPPCGVLNPINEEMYNTMGLLFSDIFEIFDHDVFHMGSDEFKFRCWEENQDIRNYITAQGKNVTDDTLMELWGQFQDRAYNQVTAVTGLPNFTAIVWSSELASIEHIRDYLSNEKYVVQLWTTGDDPLIPFLIENGYRILFSNYDALYLDCGFSAWLGGGLNWCAPYSEWQKIYDNDPLGLLLQHSNMTEGEIDDAFKAGLIMGGETPMWMEQSDDHSVEARVWPRASAWAERTWSNPKDGWRAAETRMVQNRQRLVKRGIKADGLTQEWCVMNEGLCSENA